MLVASGTIWALSALGCGPNAPKTPPPVDRPFVVAVPQSRLFNPNGGIRQIESQLSYERLTGSDASGRTVPRLLERWSESADGLTWRLVLASSLRFQDRTPLVAADVRRLIDEARAEPSDRTSAICVPDIRETSVAGDREIVVRLGRRCAFLLDDLDMLISGTATKGRPDVGTGPFVEVSASKDEVTLRANPYHHQGEPAIRTVVVKSYDTLRTAWADMMRGGVDFLWEVGPDAGEFLRGQPGIDVRSFTSYYAYTIITNAARPVFRDRAVRRALNLAVNRNELLQQGLRGQGEPGADSIWPSHWARDGSIAPWPYNPAEASGLLESAGLNTRRPAGGSRRDGSALAFTCLLPTNFTVYERLALLVQRQLRAINVEMAIEAVPADVYSRRIVAGDFDAVLTNLVGGPYRTIHYAFWHSPGTSQRMNYWGYQDAAVDTALERMRDAANDGDTRAAMRALSLALRENPPAVVLAWSKTVQAVSRRFNIPENAEGRDLLHSLNRWTVRTQGRSR